MQYYIQRKEAAVAGCGEVVGRKNQSPTVSGGKEGGQDLRERMHPVAAPQVMSFAGNRGQSQKEGDVTEGNGKKRKKSRTIYS